VNATSDRLDPLLPYPPQGNQDTHFGVALVEQAFHHLPPAGMLVDSIQDNPPRSGRNPLSDDLFTVFSRTPVQKTLHGNIVIRKQGFGKGGFAHLPGTGEKQHLFRKVQFDIPL